MCLQIEAYAQSSLPAENCLFDNEKILKITLQGNLRGLLNDRDYNPKYYPVTLIYTKDDSTSLSLSTEIKTRGHFRRLKENCVYPPLLIHFINNDSLNKSIFKDQDKLKLVLHCQGEEYVVAEWLVYKLYSLLTNKSFKTRLVKITLNDTKRKKDDSPFYGILLEDEKDMAKRNGSIIVNKKIKPYETKEKDFLTMAVFQYLVGNTDWSIQYLQNIKLLAADSLKTPTAVPYDFDHAGIVNAPYAYPPEELLLNSVRERRYRGYCITDMKKFDSTIALFNHLKKHIYSLYNDCDLLNAKYKKATIKYLDEFYAIINDQEKMQIEFAYPCNKKGTGNVIIKGLKDD